MGNSSVQASHFPGTSMQAMVWGTEMGERCHQGSTQLFIGTGSQEHSLYPRHLSFQVSEAVGAGVERIRRPDLHLFFANTWRSSLWACKGPCRQGQWPRKELVKFPCNVVWRCYRKKWEPRYPTLISENNGDRRGHRHLFLYWRLFPQVTNMADIK